MTALNFEQATEAKSRAVEKGEVAFFKTTYSVAGQSFLIDAAVHPVETLAVLFNYDLVGSAPSKRAYCPLGYFAASHVLAPEEASSSVVDKTFSLKELEKLRSTLTSGDFQR